MNLIYLAKPTFGGWVSFTAHLANLRDSNLFKISKKTETSGGQPKYRPYGYGIQYRNISLVDFKTLITESSKPYLITAIDSNYYKILPDMPPNGHLVIHDPTEVKTKKGELVEYLKPFQIITIRESVSKYLNTIGISNRCLSHPYVSIADSFKLCPLSNKSGAVAISRIDYDKHTEIILKANNILLEPIKIYGCKNDRYVYHHLKDLDPMKELMPGSNYKGKFPKDFKILSKILSPAKFMVDMSRIKDDGGGSQYTFLEAIDFGCILILHQDWVSRPDSKFRVGVNCLAVSNEDELAALLNSNISSQLLTDIRANAKELLEVHLEAGGWELNNVNHSSVSEAPLPALPELN